MYEKEESFEEVTPVKLVGGKGVKGKSKPRFSLFAVQSPAHEDEEVDDEPVHHEEEEPLYSSPPPPPKSRNQQPPPREDDSIRSEEEGERPLSLSQLGSSSTSSSTSNRHQSTEERNVFLKRALFDLQRINGVFETYIQTVEEVNAYHAVS